MKITFIHAFILFISITLNGYSQEIPEDYKMLISIDRPQFLKQGIPYKIILDSANRYIVISYDYNPTYPDLYTIENSQFVKRIKIKGFVY